MNDRLDSIDSYTVKVLHKVNRDMGAEEIRQMFVATDNDERVFPGLNTEQLQKTCELVIRLRSQGYLWRTFKDLHSDGSKFWQKFYNVIEQIPCWFDKEAAKGYEGGGPIVKRPRVETTLRERFGDFGYYAIMWYVMVYHGVLYESGKGRECDLLSYTDRFERPEWYQLAYVLFICWGATPIYDRYILAFQKVKKFKVHS